MKRNAFDQYFKDPDRKAKLFLFTTGLSIVATVTLVIGTLIFIALALGIIWIKGLKFIYYCIHRY